MSYNIFEKIFHDRFYDLSFSLYFQAFLFQIKVVIF